MKKYENYFGVDFDYFNELPVGWKLLPNIAIFEERIQKGYEKEDLLSVTISKGIIRQADLEDKRDISNENKSNYKLVRKGDLAYNKMRMWQGSVGYSKFQGIASPAYVILRPKIEINPKYYHYQFRSGFYVNYSKRASYGICDDQLSLRYKDFKRMLSIVPPLSMQNLIVEYLDKKTEQVEKYLSAKSSLLQKIVGKRISIFSLSIQESYFESLVYNIITGQMYPESNTAEEDHFDRINGGN
jgi:type I restriction enzyme, S subunit